MPYTVEYGLRKYIEVLRSNYSGTIADMLKFDVVSCDEENDNYTYTGNNYENMLFFGLTMTETKHKGKHIAFYSQSHDGIKKEYYLKQKMGMSCLCR